MQRAGAAMGGNSFFSRRIADRKNLTLEELALEHGLGAKTIRQSPPSEMDAPLPYMRMASTQSDFRDGRWKSAIYEIHLARQFTCTPFEYRAHGAQTFGRSP